MGRVSRERQEYRRSMVECLLQSDLSVDEWSKRNGICRGTMYNWLSEFARTEPELFGGKQNIADTRVRNWIQITKKNIADSHALALREPAGVVIVDSDGDIMPAPDAAVATTLPSSSIQVAIKGARVVIPADTAQSDIARVLEVVAAL